MRETRTQHNHSKDFTFGHFGSSRRPHYYIRTDLNTIYTAPVSLPEKRDVASLTGSGTTSALLSAPYNTNKKHISFLIIVLNHGSSWLCETGGWKPFFHFLLLVSKSCHYFSYFLEGFLTVKRRPCDVNLSVGSTLNALNGAEILLQLHNEIFLVRADLHRCRELRLKRPIVTWTHKHTVISTCVKLINGKTWEAVTL